MKNYDAIIIGFGKGGKTLAGKLAQTGKSIALIEKDSNMYGGTCINVGCIPSKSLINSSKKTYLNDEIKEKAEKYRIAIEEKNKLTEMLRKKNYDKLASISNVTIYNGQARFINSSQVEIKTINDKFSISGEKIFINTGSTSFIPPIKGITETKGVYTSSELMDLNVLPENLVIIGGGYIGLEFASMYSRFGSKVTVIQDGEIFLPKEDTDISNEIKTILENCGIKFYLGAKIKEIKNGPSILFNYQGQEYQIKTDAILVATGRIPNTKDLNCEAAGIELTPRGAVKVDENLLTTAKNIWAMGDVTGNLQHTYISLDDSRIIYSQLFEEKTYNILNRKNVPYSVFLSTPYSRVGMNEREAKDAGYKIKVGKLLTSAIPKAHVQKSTKGMLKAIIDQNTNKILGVMLLCEESFEMINIVKLAMDTNIDYTVLQNQIFTHPTMSEALNDLFSI